MDDSTREFVRARAEYRCEYCLLRQEQTGLSHHVEHIIAKQHGGSDELPTLALACNRCNAHKGPNLTGIDQASGEIVSLFHPRREVWADHFEFVGPRIVGLTSIGRVTV
jgi:HNH endonuclease